MVTKNTSYHPLMGDNEPAFYSRRGSFVDGTEITTSNEIAYNEADGNFYCWAGALPKVVPAGSTPLTSGGVSPTAWVNVKDGSFPSAIKSKTGSSNVGLSLGGTVQDAIQYVTPLMFGGVGDGVNDDSQAFIDMVTTAVTMGLRMCRIPAGYKWVVSKTINLGGVGYDGRYGVQIIGDGVDNTQILFKPTAPDLVLFDMSGGHGTTTGRALKALSITPFDSSYEGKGVGLRLHDVCFAVVEDVNIRFLSKGILLANLNPKTAGRDDGDFTEFCRISRMRLDRNTINVHYLVTNGNASFHGVAWRDMQIQMMTGTEGYVFESTGARAHPYGNLFHNINFFGTSASDCTAIRLKNTRVDVSHGFMTLEQGAKFVSMDDSWFHISGNFKWLIGGSNIVFDCPAGQNPQLGVPAHFIWDNLTSAKTIGNFASVELASYYPEVLRPTWGESSDLSAPGHIRIRSDSSNTINGLASLIRSADTIGWWDMVVVDGQPWQSATPRYNRSAAGDRFQGYSTSGRLYLSSKHTVSSNVSSVFVGTGTFAPEVTNTLSSGTDQLRWTGLFLNDSRITGIGFIPYTSNTLSIGLASNTVKDVFTQNAPTVVSDRDHKTEIMGIPVEVLQAWGTVDFCMFKLKAAVAEKGDKARFHFGVIAQDIKSAFEAAGLDATDYGILCYEEWEDEFDEDGTLITPKGNIWMVRMEECLVLEAAYMRWKLLR